MRNWMTLVTVFMLCAWATPVHAFMWEVGDEELSEVTGEGFSSFTLTDDVIRMQFNICTSTYTEIQSLKMGYYSIDGVAPSGWDQNWENVSLGSPTTDLSCEGIYIEAGFSNIANPNTRSLDYIKFGTPKMNGPLSANFISFSGHIEEQTPTGPVVHFDGRRQNLGVRTIMSTNSEFYVQMHRTEGWSFYWNNATISAP